MGGHGGLNILPQKKWNVYNRDNRTVVQRDQRLDRQRRERESQQNRNRQTDSRLEHLREEVQQQKPRSFLTHELERIDEEHRHVNLFEKEERLIENQEVLDGKILNEVEFMKDKPLDATSKFLGSYNVDKNKPWYLKTKRETEQQRIQAQRKAVLKQQDIQSVKKSTSIVTKQVFKKEALRENSRQRSRQNKVKKEELSKIEQLREQRRKREEKEKARAKELLLRHSGKNIVGK